MHRSMMNVRQTMRKRMYLVIEGVSRCLLLLVLMGGHLDAV